MYTLHPVDLFTFTNILDYFYDSFSHFSMALLCLLCHKSKDIVWSSSCLHFKYFWIPVNGQVLQLRHTEEENEMRQSWEERKSMQILQSEFLGKKLILKKLTKFEVKCKKLTVVKTSYLSALICLFRYNYYKSYFYR